MEDDSSRSCRGLEGTSHAMVQLSSMIQRASKCDAPVLILGECGTGKELVAHSLHDLSLRRHRPFIPVDCTTLTSSLIETELFGHVQGAFTGATDRKKGLFEAASGGTLFLDEIGELPVSLQAKLLRALQQREIRPVGSVVSIRVDVRIIAATNRNVESMVRAGVFRQDLYFRLNVIQVEITPLRERTGDVPALARTFVERHQTPGSQINISDAAMEKLQAYGWPGNVRELENSVIRALTFCSGSVLEPRHFELWNETVRESGRACVIRTMSELKRRAIVSALRESHGDKRVAARLLGIGRTTLYRKLKALPKSGQPTQTPGPKPAVQATDRCLARAGRICT